MTKDKSIIIRMKKEGINTTVSVKQSVLDLYSSTFFDKDYADNKKFINAQIKNLINPRTDKSMLSNLVAKFLLSCIEEEVKRLKKQIF